MMAEYIKRKTLKEHLYGGKFREGCAGCDEPGEGCIECIVDEIDNFPAADVAPVRRGRWNWVHKQKGGFEYYTGREANPNTEYPDVYTIQRDERREVDEPYCPFCKKLNESVWLNFCPNCGADMREVPNDD